eukprot:m.212519 g.212519  ORF g.212519 m.212519 type:complete len:95 (+) comp19045_c0_seq5:848-1132(+)
MVDSAGTTADEEFVKRGRRAFVAQRSHTLGNIEIVQRYHRVETLSKPSFLKRMSEQVFMFHAFFKQGSAAFDELYRRSSHMADMCFCLCAVLHL